MQIRTRMAQQWHVPKPATMSVGCILEGQKSTVSANSQLQTTGAQKPTKEKSWEEEETGNGKERPLGSEAQY